MSQTLQSNRRVNKRNGFTLCLHRAYSLAVEQKISDFSLSARRSPWMVCCFPVAAVTKHT